MQQSTETQEQVAQTEAVQTPVLDLTPLNYQERQEIKELSKLFLGSSSRWQKITESGSPSPKKDAEGKPIIVGYNHKVKTKNQDGKMVPSPMYLMEYVRTEPRTLLNQLRAAKAMMDKQREEQRRAREAAQAAEDAMGSSGAL